MCLYLFIFLLLIDGAGFVSPRNILRICFANIICYTLLESVLHEVII